MSKEFDHLANVSSDGYLCFRIKDTITEEPIIFDFIVKSQNIIIIIPITLIHRKKEIYACDPFNRMRLNDE